MRGKAPFSPVDFGPNTRVVMYEPEFIIGDARIADDGLLYVAFDYALLEFVTAGMGPYHGKLAVLTAGVLRPIPTPPQQYGDLSFLNQAVQPLIFNAGDDYFLDYDGIHRLPDKYPQPTVLARPSALAAHERCVSASNTQTSVLDAVSTDGRRRVLISRDEFGRLNIPLNAGVKCYHFARRNIFEIDARDAGSKVYVEVSGQLELLVSGIVLAAGDHRVLIGADAGGNHQWLLEGFAL